MTQDTTFVGLDVHKTSISIAVADRGDVRPLGTIPNTPEAVAKLVKGLGSPSRLSCCYEAGPMWLWISAAAHSIGGHLDEVKRVLAAGVARQQARPAGT
jgi:hypothetical protein